MDILVFYEYWQMECCGYPFKVGDKIKWLVTGSEGLRLPIDVGHVDYVYEAHSSEWEKIYVLEGTVTEISILYVKYAPMPGNPRMLVPERGSGKLASVKSAYDGDEESEDELKIDGYLVKLKNVSVRPAKKEEVTFN